MGGGTPQPRRFTSENAPSPLPRHALLPNTKKHACIQQNNTRKLEAVKHRFTTMNRTVAPPTFSSKVAGFETNPLPHLLKCGALCTPTSSFDSPLQTRNHVNLLFIAPFVVSASQQRSFKKSLVFSWGGCRRISLMFPSPHLSKTLS